MLKDWLSLLDSLSGEYSPEETRAVCVTSLRKSGIFFALHNSKMRGCSAVVVRMTEHNNKLDECVIQLWQLTLNMLVDFELAIRTHMSHVISPLFFVLTSDDSSKLKATTTSTDKRSTIVNPASIDEIGYSPKFAYQSSLKYLTQHWWSADLATELLRMMMKPKI